MSKNEVMNEFLKWAVSNLERPRDQAMVTILVSTFLTKNNHCSVGSAIK